jgi:hypothetical protein
MNFELWMMIVDFGVPSLLGGKSLSYSPFCKGGKRKGDFKRAKG